MNDELIKAMKRAFDELEGKRRERVRCLEERFRECPESLTDRDRLEWITQKVRKQGFGSDPHFEMLVTLLTFAKETIDPENLKTAWKEFLTSGASCDSPTSPEEWDLTCDRDIAHRFEHFGKTAHSISVYEHILSEIIGGDPNYRDGVEECLFKLFEYYTKGTSTRRAREILTLIRTYNENGWVSDARYYEVLPQETELFYRELGERVDQGRRLVEERLRLEIGEMFENLHPMTRGFIVDAELWSDNRMRNLEPTAGPRRWILAVESEFHHKVFRKNRAVLERALQGNRLENLLRPEQSCSIGQIALLVRKAGSGRPENALVTAVFRSLRGSKKFAGAQIDIPQVMPKHRERFAHVNKGGDYTQEECNDFIREVRDSEWVHQFLLALQPD